jgi:hypothetical protein
MENSILSKTISLNEIERGDHYGGWLLKDRIIPVDYENHEGIAILILKELLNINEEKRVRDFCKKYSIYRVMMRLGFIRVHYSRFNDSIDLEKSKHHKLNEFQKRIASRANYISELEIYYYFGGKVFLGR